MKLVLIILALCLLSVTVAEIRLLECMTASTGKCNVLGTGCNLPYNINNCTVNYEGKTYLCTNPPVEYIYVGATCNNRIGCTSCSANIFYGPQPICEWRN